MKYLFAFLFLAFSLPDADLIKKTPITFVAKVTAVKDGDTYIVLANNKQTTIRLAHVDCPEKKQDYSQSAKQFASDLCFGKTVTVVSDGTTDRYKRLIAEIYVGKECVNKELVANGFAWHYKQYSTDKEYAKLEIKARKKQRGLWKDPAPIAPWKWRKQKRKKGN